jgi:hypothetical protein
MTPENVNHLPKRVGVDLECISESSSSLTHLLVDLRYYRMLGPTINMILYLLLLC